MTRTAIISVDGHVRASRTGYGDYLEDGYLEAYDDFVAAADADGTADAGNVSPDLDSAVQWDSDLRLQELERAGVVAEVLFPNGQPFQLNPFDDHAKAATAELAAAGRSAYNRWLVDFCAAAPERRRGQLQMSFVDIDAAVRDVEWAREHGLGGVMLPELTRESRTLIDPALDPIWAACQATGLPVSVHGGASIPEYGPARFAAMLTLMAENAFFSNRSLWMLIAGGVFDRFPDLRVCYVETQPYVLVTVLAHLDCMVDPVGDWMGFARTMDREESTQRLPSEYLGTNVFVGVSPFTPVQMPFEELLGADGSDARLSGVHIGSRAAMFGVDYPQAETIVDRTRAEVAGLLATPGATEDDVEQILMGNAARVYGFDIDALRPHVDNVGFDLTELRSEADELARAMPRDTKVPLMRTAVARATPSTATA
jgi:predicted TIM-barrel fold metal-dependent hydrolase